MGFLIFRKELIKIATKLSASVTYTATGTQTTFTIPFDYLRKTFIHVVVDDEEITDGFSVEDRTVVFITAPTKDANVTIYRSTPTERLVAWGDATILKARDMTISEVQQLHLIEESQDWSKSNSITLNDEETAWQGRGYPLSNISDPVDTQDVVTKNYLENTKDSFTVTMNSIKTATQQYADEAKASKTSAEASVTSAGNYAGSASTSATNADKSATSAETSATNASTYATNAATSATAAATSATNASSSATAAQSASSTSSNFATSARSSANEALTYRNNASTYAANAKTYMETAKDYSENVNVFIPSVSSAGVISWTNKAGLTNPTSVNIKGDKGATGTAGKAATIAIGTVTTGEAGTSVSVTNSGTTSDAILNFTIPKGKDGKDGGIEVDTALSSTSTNPLQNKVIYTELSGKAGLAKANAFTSNNTFGGTSTFNDTGYFANGLYVSNAAPMYWYQGTPTRTIGSITSTNYTGNAATATKATQDADGNAISSTYAKTADLASVATSGSYNDLSDTPTIPDTDSFAQTSKENTWRSSQRFDAGVVIGGLEKYAVYLGSRTISMPSSQSFLYIPAEGNYTLDLSTIVSKISYGYSTLVTALITSTGDYTLTINGLDVIRYIGSASDIAIKSTGTLLNILLCGVVIDNDLKVMGVIQATALNES